MSSISTREVKELEISMQTNMGPAESARLLQREKETEIQDPFLEENGGKYPTTNSFKIAKLDAQQTRRKIEISVCQRCGKTIEGKSRYCFKCLHDPSRPKEKRRPAFTSKRRTCITPGCNTTFPALGKRKWCTACQEKQRKNKGKFTMTTNKKCWICGELISKKSGRGKQSSMHDHCKHEFLSTAKDPKSKKYRYSKSEIKTIINAIENLKNKGCSQKLACIHEGVSLKTYYKWKNLIPPSRDVTSSPTHTERILHHLTSWVKGREISELKMVRKIIDDALEAKVSVLRDEILTRMNELDISDQKKKEFLEEVL